ncbi:MAG: redoxin domain-containing protein [Planctomycetes bacterium]|nr:redoxin domain-containing protein [Planctomycetota bacterium]
MAAGVCYGLAAARVDRRWFVRALAVLDAALLAFFTWAFFGLAALPVTHAEDLQRAPDFTLSDAGGRPVTLSQRLGGGPVLLAFWRGHW